MRIDNLSMKAARLGAILLLVLAMLSFHVDAQGGDHGESFLPTLSVIQHTESSDFCKSLKPRIKKQLRRLVAL
ncbi:hypothetical protein [Serratia liquefaciens]|uniref:hypothetical protein n=1 Tax=Serratia liquefaciens TaxID=614 RepID=UPI0022DD0843|nr:hypothetical protein [Serratia liquefaciens]WBL74405.1 hypothetical protein LQ945_08995 [Serratia liquefaciens]